MVSSNDSLFRQYCQQCQSAIAEGISNDESGNHQAALQHYTKALHLIQSYLDPSVHHHAHDMEWIQKLRTYREMVSDRIQQLNKNRVIQQKPPQPQPFDENAGYGNTSNSNGAGGYLDAFWSVFGFSSTSSQSNVTSDCSPTVKTLSEPSQVPINSQVGGSRLSNMQFPLQNTSNNAFHTAKPTPFQNRIPSEKNIPNNIIKPKPIVGNGKKLTLDRIPEFKGVDKKLLDHILNDIIEKNDKVIEWDDIAGLKEAKQILHETIVLPSLRPDIFQGLRAPARGVLLFGPPGNGKTLLAKAVSSQCKSTFFSVSASSLVSKWHGEGEKLVKALFAAANYLAPSVIFIDEIDSILTSRSSNEHEASRRLKTEFLVQLDGVTANLNPDNRVLVMGATNRPYELDDAILRRFVKRIYIPLPDAESRVGLIKNALSSQRTKLSGYDYEKIAQMTEGYSGSDLKALCQEASMVSIRELGSEKLLTISAEQVRPVNLNDFIQSVKRVKPSVSPESINELVKWNKLYGTFS
jgi:ATP-dependent 26S proteasome regulatory subunit